MASVKRLSAGARISLSVPMAPPVLDGRQQVFDFGRIT
jgi:hypothetical protein